MVELAKEQLTARMQEHFLNFHPRNILDLKTKKAAQNNTKVTFIN